MKRILLATLISILTGTVSFAHKTTADSPATKEDIQKYLDVMHSREMMTKMMDAMAEPMRQMMHEQYLKDKDKLPPDFEEQMDKKTQDYIRNLPFDEMLQAMVPVYEKHLTKGDVDALLVFYSSPTGQKMIRELPAMTAESMQAVMPILRSRMEALTQQMQQEIAQIKKDYNPTGKKSQSTPN